MALNPITARWGYAHLVSTDARRMMYANSGPWAHRAKIGAGNDAENFQVTINEATGTALDISTGLLIYRGFVLSNDTPATVELEMPAATVYKKAFLYIGIKMNQNVESIEFGVEYSEEGANPDAINYQYPKLLYQIYDYRDWIIEQKEWRLGYSYAIPLAKVLLHGNTIESLEELIPVWNAKQFYAPGDSVDLTYNTFAGFLTSGSKDIYFFIPVRKDVVGVTGATISGIFTIRHSDGGYIGSGNGQTLEDLGNVTITPLETGMYVRCTLPNSITLANNAPITVVANYGAKLTFNGPFFDGPAEEN